MAHIFKHPQANQKGIIIFTHKEVKYFSNTIKDTRFQTYNQLKNQFFSFKDLKPAFKSDIYRLRERYFIGMHFGWRHEQFPTLPYMDFYMAGTGTVDFEEPENVFLIPFNSRSFTSSIFRPRPELPKRYDLISVGRNIRFKNFQKLLVNIRTLFDQGKKYRVLLVVLPVKNKNSKKAYTNLASDYYSMFNKEERSRLVLMYLNPELSVMGLPREELVHFYQQSKVFTLYSQKEGESRVISEALLCGLPVVVKSDLAGGGRDLLHEGNSVQFDEYENAHLALAEAIDNWERFDVANDALFNQTREDYTIERLKEYFHKLYQQHGQTFDGTLINTDELADRLPAHFEDLPWAKDRFSTADITSKNQFRIFIDHIQNEIKTT